MVCWHCPFLFFNLPCALHQGKYLFWVCQPWCNLLILGIINKKKYIHEILKSWLLHCMSNVKLCILKLLSSSYCNNWLLILTRMSIFLLILCYRLPQEKQNTKGNYTDPTWWSVAFHSLFWLPSVPLSCHRWKQIGT